MENKKSVIQRSTIKVSELQTGTFFRFQGKRKWRVAHKIVELPDHDHIEPIGRKRLIILENCGQVFPLNTTEIEIETLKPVN